MQKRDVISAFKYVAGMRHEFMLSEIAGYVEGASVKDVYEILAPLAFGLGIRLEPFDGDYRAIRTPARPVALSDKARKAQESYLSSPAVPERIQGLIEGYIERKTGKRWDDPQVLQRIRSAIVTQKAEYWKEGEERKIRYGKGYSVLGYLAYQFPVYFVEWEHILFEMALDGLLKDRMRVLDAGAGPGTATLALADFYHRTGCGESIAYSLDKYDENIEAFSWLVPEYAKGSGVTVEKPIRADLLSLSAEDLPDGVDLVIFSNVLNELEAGIERKAEIVKMMAERLASDGSMVIVEPADRANSTRMRELVVALMGKGLGVYSPCSFIWGSRCHPVSCWTFEEKEDIKPPRLMQKIAEEEPFRYINKDIKYSYAILRKDGLSREKYRVPEKAPFARLSRLGARLKKRINVVAAVMSHDLGDEKDHVFKVCDGTSARPVYAILPRYHVSPSNEMLLKAGYGQILEMYGVIARHNREYDAYNLLVTRNTLVRPVRA